MFWFCQSELTANIQVVQFNCTCPIHPQWCRDRGCVNLKPWLCVWNSPVGSHWACGRLWCIARAIRKQKGSESLWSSEVIHLTRKHHMTSIGPRPSPNPLTHVAYITCAKTVLLFKLHNYIPGKIHFFFSTLHFLGTFKFLSLQLFILFEISIQLSNKPTYFTSERTQKKQRFQHRGTQWTCEEGIWVKVHRHKDVQQWKPKQSDMPLKWKSAGTRWWNNCGCLSSYKQRGSTGLTDRNIQSRGVFQPLLLQAFVSMFTGVKMNYLFSVRHSNGQKCTVMLPGEWMPEETNPQANEHHYN